MNKFDRRSFGELVIALGNDVAALASFPVGALTTAFQAHIRTKVEAARHELLIAMRAGDIDQMEAANEDETISVLYRIYIAARDNAARLNLQLMSKCAVSLQKRDKLYADEFGKYADTLSKMSRDQVVVATAYIVEAKRLELEFTQHTGPRDVPYEHVMSNASLRGYESSVGPFVEQRLHEAGFNSDDVAQLSGELVGLGLLRIFTGAGHLMFTPTPKLHELSTLEIW